MVLVYRLVLLPNGNIPTYLLILHPVDLFQIAM